MHSVDKLNPVDYILPQIYAKTKLIATIDYARPIYVTT